MNSKEEREVITIKTHVTSFKDDSFNDPSIYRLETSPLFSERVWRANWSKLCCHLNYFLLRNFQNIHRKTNFYLQNPDFHIF